VFIAIAALALASASAPSPAPTSTTPLTSTASWWERVTVNITDDGKTHSCQYVTSLQPAAAQNCTASNSASASALGGKDQYTSITFERRFTPGATPQLESLQPGERLLGGQVMALAIDARGAVKNCRVVATSGAVTPQYGCNEAQAERFQASASDTARTPEREGYLSIIVYGHAEHEV
jgi:hypothetical protein